MNLKTTLTLTLIATLILLSAGCVEESEITQVNPTVISTPNIISTPELIITPIATPEPDPIETSTSIPKTIPTPKTTPIIASATNSTVPTKIDLSIGETATNSQIEVTVISAYKKYYYEYYDYGYVMGETASQGNTFIFANINIKNVGSDREYPGNYDLSATDSNGYRYDPLYYYGDDGLEWIQEIYQNQQIEGIVIFEVPKDATGLKIQHNFGNIFTDTKIASWSID